MKQLLDWELVLATDHVHSSLRDLATDQLGDALPLLLDDFQQLLRDALDLLRELGEADDHGVIVRIGICRLSARIGRTGASAIG